MTKTIEEMVQELDVRFDGVVTSCLSNERSYSYSNGRYGFMVDYYESYDGKKSTYSKLDGLARISFKKETGGYSDPVLSITFDVGLFGECIAKAHDYFIVKGGTL